MRIKEISKRHILFVDEGIFKIGENNDIAIDLNLHLICGERHNFIIDTGLGSDQANFIIDYINKNEDSRKKEIIVINTHYHWDHIWGNYIFKDNTIIAHSSCYSYIDNYWEKMYGKHKHLLKGSALKCLPNILFEKEIYFPEDGVRIFHTPGHSIDSISILDEKEGVLNVGDNIGDSIEIPIPYYEVSDDKYLSLLEFYNKLNFSTLISGHNKVLEKSFISTIIEEMKKI